MEVLSSEFKYLGFIGIGDDLVETRLLQEDVLVAEVLVGLEGHQVVGHFVGVSLLLAVDLLRTSLFPDHLLHLHCPLEDERHLLSLFLLQLDHLFVSVGLDLEKNH